MYSNADIDKTRIFTENRNMSGVYRWINNNNGKSYVGSSSNLSVRFYTYYSLRYLAKSNRPVDRALLKHGFSFFTLEILEHCDLNVLLSREQYYLDLLKPEYNIAETAGSTLGYKHTDQSIAKMRDFVLSDEVKTRKALATNNATASRKVPIILEDINTKEMLEFTSLTEAGKALGVTKGAVSQALLNKRILSKTYSIKRKKEKHKNMIQYLISIRMVC